MKTTQTALFFTLAASTLAKPLQFKRASNVSTPAYSLLHDYTSSPNNFFNSFSAWGPSDGQDPTGDGSSSYTPLHTAIKDKLVAYMPPRTTVNSSHLPINEFSKHLPIYIGVDHTTSNPVSGRASLRLTGNHEYSPGTLFIAQISHMPAGCGTWPALWLLNTKTEWPYGGEVDIIENVNLAPSNQVTLHTNAGCRIDPSASNQNTMTGSVLTSNCDVNDPTQSPNAGCGITAPTNQPTYGAAFNGAGGGTYAVQWLTTGFNVWFFPASSATHAQLSSPNTIPDPRRFGTPIATFAGNECDWQAHFADMALVINTEICGAWAGNPDLWRNDGCAAQTGFATCKEMAMASPQAFEEAYWVFDALRVYQTS